MDILELKELFLKVATSIPGVKEINQLSLDENLTKDEEDENISLEDKINIVQTDKGYNFFIAFSLIEDVSAKRIVAELKQVLNYELKKNKIKMNKLIVIIKGVK